MTSPATDSSHYSEFSRHSISTLSGSICCGGDLSFSVWFSKGQRRQSSDEYDVGARADKHFSGRRQEYALRSTVADESSVRGRSSDGQSEARRADETRCRPSRPLGEGPTLERLMRQRSDVVGQWRRQPASPPVQTTMSAAEVSNSQIAHFDVFTGC